MKSKNNNSDNNFQREALFLIFTMASIFCITLIWLVLIINPNTNSHSITNMINRQAKYYNYNGSYFGVNRQQTQQVPKLNATLFNGKYEYPEINEILDYLWSIDDVKFIKPTKYINRTRNTIRFEADFLYDNFKDCNIAVKDITFKKVNNKWVSKSIIVVDSYRNVDRQMAFSKYFGLSYRGQ